MIMNLVISPCTFNKATVGRAMSEYILQHFEPRIPSVCIIGLRPNEEQFSSQLSELKYIQVNDLIERTYICVFCFAMLTSVTYCYPMVQSRVWKNSEFAKPKFSTWLQLVARIATWCGIMWIHTKWTDAQARWWNVPIILDMKSDRLLHCYCFDDHSPDWTSWESWEGWAFDS
jgi:hypothetical protein